MWDKTSAIVSTKAGSYFRMTASKEMLVYVLSSYTKPVLPHGSPAGETNILHIGTVHRAETSIEWRGCKIK